MITAMSFVIRELHVKVNVIEGPSIELTNVTSTEDDYILSIRSKRGKHMRTHQLSLSTATNNSLRGKLALKIWMMRNLLQLVFVARMGSFIDLEIYPVVSWKNFIRLFTHAPRTVYAQALLSALIQSLKLHQIEQW